MKVSVVTSGRLNKLLAVVPIPTINDVEVPLLVNVNSWPLTNGWFGRYIVLVGIGTSFVVSPIV